MVTRNLRIENQFQPASRLIYIYIYMLHLDTCSWIFQFVCSKPFNNKDAQMAVESTKTAGLAISESWSIWSLNQKKTAWRQTTQREKGVSPQRDGNRKPEGVAFEHSICITLLNAVPKELVLVSYNRKACLRPWFRKCSNERCWWTISNFREMPKSKKTPFIYCNACCIRLLYLDNLAFWLSAMEVASKPATVAFRIAQQTIHICWNIWNPVRTNSGVGIHNKSFCSQPCFQCVQSYTTRAIVLFIHSLLWTFPRICNNLCEASWCNPCVALGWCLAL